MKTIKEHQPETSATVAVANLDQLWITLGKLEVALGAIDEAIVWTDPVGKIQWWNASFEHLIGRPPREVLGSYLIDLLPLERQGQILPPEAHPASLALASGREVKEECEFRQGDQKRVVEMVGTHVWFNGRQTSVMFIIRDTTEALRRCNLELVHRERILRRLLEKLHEQKRKFTRTPGDLQVDQRKLIQLEKMAAVGSFSVGVAHEVKNPLGIILSGVDLLKRRLAKSRDADTQTALEMIQQATFRANAIVRGLLQFARPSQCKLEKVKPEDLIQGALKLIQYRIPLHNVAMETFFAYQNCWVDVDKNQMEQVLFNLLLNAVEAMPQGGTLALKTYPEAPSKEEGAKPLVVIEVTDTGEGIPRENLPRIFEPFFTTKGDKKGTGLGLSTAKTIVEDHGGSLKIESEEGKGTAAKVLLPLAEDEMDLP